LDWLLPAGRSGPHPFSHDAEVPEVQVVTLPVRPEGHTPRLPPESAAPPLELPLLDPLLEAVPLLDPLLDVVPLLDPLLDVVPLLDPLLDPLLEVVPLLDPLLLEVPASLSPGPVPLLLPQPATTAPTVISAPTQTVANL
jgi:hypothetical protein